MSFLSNLKALVADSDDAGVEIFAPVSGEIVPIEDVPDTVFAAKVVGDGVAIKPTGNKVVAPCDGTIGKVSPQNHAFSLESSTGIELLVHFGLDTCALNGEGFRRVAQDGQQVKRGDVILEFDLPLLEAKAKSTLTPIVVANLDELRSLTKLSGAVVAGETPVFRVVEK